MRVSDCLIEPVVTAKDIVSYRESLAMSQLEFAEAFQIPLGTLRRWEQGASKPQISLAKLNVCNSVLTWMQNRTRRAA